MYAMNLHSRRKHVLKLFILSFVLSFVFSFVLSFSVLDLKFHQVNPDHLFSCSEDGSVWHWNISNDRGLYRMGILHNFSSIALDLKSVLYKLIYLSFPWYISTFYISGPTTWLSADPHCLNVDELINVKNFAVNSLDIVDDILLCGTDGEQIYYINNLSLH